MTLTVGIDIGGTKIAAGVVDDNGAIVDELLRSTPAADADAVLADLCQVISELAQRHEVVAVGIGAAGWIDAAGAKVLFAPHLPWRERDLRNEITARCELPVLLDNDANAAGWAEYRFGAARNAQVTVMITLGTGIGGALILDGQLYRGAYGLAGEFGHQVVVPDGRLCACGNRGCWEMYVSGSALDLAVREVRAELDLTVREVSAELDLAQGAEQVSGAMVAAAAASGNERALAIFAELGQWLGIGLANIAAALDPELFVIGGGLSAVGELLLAPARRTFATALSGKGFRPLARIEQAQLGPSAGMIGAADLARRLWRTSIGEGH